MQVYLVGGAVRDAQLGLPVAERDWCVVGSTPDAMIALNYRAAMLDQNFQGATAAAEAAATLLNSAPEMIAARRIVIETFVRQQNWPEALEVLDEALRPEE